ncbi:histidine phosphatase family protein [Caldiplasma sukawensis]
MKNIAILIRHGESEANAKNIVSHEKNLYPLTERGREQAARTGRNLYPLREYVSEMISSPILRAIETAEIVRENMGVSKKIMVDENMKENDLGPFNNGPSYRLPKYHKEGGGIESFHRVAERMYNSISSRDGINIYFSHMLPIKALVSKILNLEEEEAHGIKIENCSVSTIDLSEMKVLSIGAVDFSEHFFERISNIP